jgi:hypothetical protein
MEVTTVGLDLAKHVFQVWTDPLSLDGGAGRDQAASRALISSNRAGLR